VTGSQLSVSVSVSWVRTNPPATADIYVGVVLPGGQVLSWVPTESGPVLQGGLAPFARNATFTPFVATGLAHAFSGAEPAGLYSIHTILVTPGADPLDARNWFSARTVPLVFRP
jgi:hypothetical protein